MYPVRLKARLGGILGRLGGLYDHSGKSGLGHLRFGGFCVGLGLVSPHLYFVQLANLRGESVKASGLD